MGSEGKQGDNGEGVFPVDGATSFTSFADLKEKIANFKDPFSRLDIRVGKIIFIQEHLLANKMYINHVRYDDRNTKSAICRLRGPYKRKQLKGKMVVIVLNVCHKVKHIESEAFILYARDNERNITELLEPSINSEVGDRVIVPGVPFIPMINMPYIKPVSEGKELLNKVTEDMKVDSEGYATYKGIRLKTTMNELITAPTLRECSVQR